MFPINTRICIPPFDPEKQSDLTVKDYVSILDLMNAQPLPKSDRNITRSFAEMSARSYYQKTPISSKGFSSLHYNSATGRLVRVREDLNSGYDINSKDLDGATALHLACFYGKLPVVRQLLSSKADLKIRDSKGCTALHNSCLSGHPGCVRLLLTAGADIDARDLKGHTPINYARNNKNYMVVNLLVARGAK
jgi:ankyrin repeat protein